MFLLKLCCIWLAASFSFGGASSIPKRLPSKPHSYTRGEDQQDLFTYDELWDLQIKYLDAFLYPANVIQAELINSTLFAENVQGRIDITNTFDGRELNTEYIFGLFSNLASAGSRLNILGYPTSYEVVQFAAKDNICSTTTRFMFNFDSFDIEAPVEWISWHEYNARGEIEQDDATLRWWDWAMDTLIASSFSVLGVDTTAAAVTGLTDILAADICTIAFTYCNSANTDAADLYDDYDSCYSYLTEQVRFGEAYELGRDTIMCRNIHQNMVGMRPSVHCPHIGPTGGDMCVDTRTYPGTVNQDYFKASFVPHGKVGKSC